MIEQRKARWFATVAAAALVGVLGAGCSTTVQGTGEAAGPPTHSATLTPSRSSAPTPTQAPTSRPAPEPDPAEPVPCRSGSPEKCFGTPLRDLIAALRAAGYQCGEDLLDQKCTRPTPDDPSYTFRGIPDTTRVYEMRFTVDVKNQPLATVQARVLDGLPRLTRLAFPHTPALAGAAMSWFRASRPTATSGPASETRGGTHDPDYTLFCHASKVSINAEGLGERWTTTMECGISAVHA